MLFLHIVGMQRICAQSSQKHSWIYNCTCTWSSACTYVHAHSTYKKLYTQAATYLLYQQTYTVPIFKCVCRFLSYQVALSVTILWHSKQSKSVMIKHSNALSGCKHIQTDAAVIMSKCIKGLNGSKLLLLIIKNYKIEFGRLCLKVIRSCYRPRLKAINQHYTIITNLEVTFYVIIQLL